MSRSAATVVKELEACHQLVWQVREAIKAAWPTPNQLDSLRFAVEEGGEAIKAQTAMALALAWENTMAQQGLSLNQAYVLACEALDGEMRKKREYARNNRKVIETTDELGDCAMMLITALGPSWEPGQWITDGVNDQGIKLESICHYVAGAANLCSQSPEGKTWRVGAELALAAIVRYLGPSLYSVLQGRLQRIATKHAGAIPNAALGLAVTSKRDVGAQRAPVAAGLAGA